MSNIRYSWSSCFSWSAQPFSCQIWPCVSWLADILRVQTCKTYHYIIEVDNHTTLDDRVHGNSDQKWLKLGNIFVDISFNHRQNRMKSEADTLQNFTKYVYTMLLLVKLVLLTLLTSNQFFSRNRYTQRIKWILKTIVFW